MCVCVVVAAPCEECTVDAVVCVKAANVCGADVAVAASV